jgi:hypothetical protein
MFSISVTLIFCLTGWADMGSKEKIPTTTKRRWQQENILDMDRYLEGEVNQFYDYKPTFCTFIKKLHYGKDGR